MSGVMMGKGASTIDGAFEFAGVLPGPYYLTAQDRSGLVASPVPVLVGDRDVDNINITVATGVTVSIRITAEGVTPGALDPLTGIIAGLRSELDGFRPRGQVARAGVVQGSNVILLRNVPSGNYQFDLSQGVLRENLKQLYIKSVRAGAQDAFGMVRVTSGADMVLDVVLTTQTGSLEGTARGRTGDPAANATVVLVPANARDRLNLYRSVVTGNDGKFRFQGIPPGDFKLFAWDDIETGAWANTEFMTSYESKGRTVRITESSKEDVQLSVIYNP
jgi:hypothetical protein